MELVEFSAIWDNFSPSGRRSRQSKTKIVTANLNSRVDEFLLGVEILNFVRSVYTQLDARTLGSEPRQIRFGAMNSLFQKKPFAIRVFIEDDRKSLFQVGTEQLRGTFVIFEFKILPRQTFAGSLRSVKSKRKKR